jgi:hypothetical protein
LYQYFEAFCTQNMDGTAQVVGQAHCIQLLHVFYKGVEVSRKRVSFLVVDGPKIGGLGQIGNHFFEGGVG